MSVATAKSLQSCPTLCDPIDGSPSGSPVPGILQARTLEWVAISFSNAWKWKVKVKSLSRVQLFTTPWTAAHQAHPSMEFSRQEYWSGVPLPSPLYGCITVYLPVEWHLRCFLFCVIISKGSVRKTRIGYWRLSFLVTTARTLTFHCCDHWKQSGFRMGGANCYPPSSVVIPLNCVHQSWVSLTYETTPKEKVVFFLPTSPLPPPCLSLSLSLSLHGHNIL